MTHFYDTGSFNGYTFIWHACRYVRGTQVREKHRHLGYDLGISVAVLNAALEDTE